MQQPPLTPVFQTPNGSWRLTGSRVSLDSVVYAYREGQSPEAIAADFPSLTLAQVFSALAYYLEHRVELDRYLLEQEARWENLRQQSEATNGPLLNRLRASRHQSLGSEGSP